MKCKDCGAEVANVGELKKHKRECPAKQVVMDPPAQGEIPLEVVREAVASVVEPKDAEPVKEPASLEAIQRMATELGIGFLIVKDSRYLVVPRRFLPDETKYLGTNNYMGIKMRGYLQDDGLVVQEKVELIR